MINTRAPDGANNKNHLHLFNHPLWHGEPNKLARLLLWVWSVPSDCDHNLDWWPWCSGGLWWSQCGHNIYICWLGWWEITDFTEVDEHRVIWSLAREWKQTLAMKHTQDFLPAQGCRPAPSDTPERTWLFATASASKHDCDCYLAARSCHQACLCQPLLVGLVARIFEQLWVLQQIILWIFWKYECLGDDTRIHLADDAILNLKYYVAPLCKASPLSDQSQEPCWRAIPG